MWCVLQTIFLILKRFTESKHVHGGVYQTSEATTAQAACPVPQWWPRMGHVSALKPLQIKVTEDHTQMPCIWGWQCMKTGGMVSWAWHLLQLFQATPLPFQSGPGSHPKLQILQDTDKIWDSYRWELAEFVTVA